MAEIRRYVCDWCLCAVDVRQGGDPWAPTPTKEDEGKLEGWKYIPVAPWIDSVQSRELVCRDCIELAKQTIERVKEEARNARTRGEEP